MIVRPRPTLLELFGIWRLSVLSKIAPQIFGLAFFSAFITALAHRWPASFRNFSVAPFTLLGIALSIFLGFRNNVSYERWWEARRQLGALIGECRSLARVLLATRGGDRRRRERTVRTVIAYVYALMAQLRGEPVPPELERDHPQHIHARNVPDALLREIAADCGTMLEAAEFGEQISQRLDERLSALAAIQVACERIRSTPVPFSYTLLLHRTAYAFCFLLPFGAVGTLGYATPVFCAVVAYAFFGLDELGSELEEPFGPWLSALPLTAMARTVEISLLEALGETDLPAPPVPIDSILR